MYEDDDITGDEESLTKQYEEIKKKSKAILNKAKYDDRDYAIIANNVFHQLCELGALTLQWHDIGPLANQVGAVDNKNDVAYIAEQVLLQLHFIERDPRNNNVRLTALGRKNCNKGIDIPPSDIQKLRMRLESNII